MKEGIVYFVGAGPGDPDLLTVKAAKILSQADCILYDYLVPEELVKKYTSPTAEIICVDKLCNEKYPDGFSKRQGLINKILVKKAKQNKNVVRLKNGDPSIFARLNEELEYLTKHKIKYRIIPGVTAATSAACYLGIPLTARNISSTLCITTGHEANLKSNTINWEYVAKMDTIVLYMSVETLKDVKEKLKFYGKPEDTPVAVISNISTIKQKYVVGSLKDIVKKVNKLKISSPAVVIIGDVVNKEKNFCWFKKTKKVLFTGISPERFFEDGLIFHIPMIEIKPLDDYTELDNYIRKICSNYQQSTINHQPFFNWIVFTSRFGVYYFFDRLFKLGYDTRILSKIKIAAIGSSTANKLKEYGIIADLVPKNECSKGLLEEFKKILKPSTINYQPSTKILLPRSDIADKGLTEGLRKLGAEVYPCVAYKNVIPENLPDIDFNFFDEIIFTSPSTVRNFYNVYHKIPEKIKVKCIGEVTEKEAKRYKFV